MIPGVPVRAVETRHDDDVDNDDDVDDDDSDDEDHDDDENADDGLDNDKRRSPVCYSALLTARRNH